MLRRFFFRLGRFFAALFKPKYWLFGRYLHRDFRATFKITGKIIDKTSGTGIGHAYVLFVDTGLDHIRSRNPQRWILKAGLGDNNGNVDIAFTYAWGAMTKQKLPAGGKFRIRIEALGHSSHYSEFDFAKLPVQGKEKLADLGTIRM